jgi:hypothetical protein
MLTSLHVVGFSAIIVQDVIEAALNSSNYEFWLRIILPIRRSKDITIVKSIETYTTDVIILRYISIPVTIRRLNDSTSEKKFL